jgi:hypothetical protein
MLWIETMDNKFPVVERNIPEEIIFHLHRFESLKSRMQPFSLHALLLVTLLSTVPRLGL